MTEAIAAGEQHSHSPSAGVPLKNMFTTKLGPLPVIVWAGIIVGAAIVIIKLRKKTAVPTSSPTAGSLDPNADGSAAAGGWSSNDASNSTGAGSGVSGSGNGNPLTNNAWAQQVANDLIAQGQDPSVVQNALANFLAGAPLTAAQQAIVNIATSKFGVPPEGVLPVVQGTTTPTGPTYQTATGPTGDPNQDTAIANSSGVAKAYNDYLSAQTATAQQHYFLIETEWWQQHPDAPKTPSAPAAASATPVPAANPPAAAVPQAPAQPSQRTYQVQPGDNLSAIANKFYGNADWNKIYQANVGIIGGNPSLIHPGQVLVIPA